MEKWPLLFLLISLFYICWTIYGSLLLNREIFIKRIDPQDFKLVGDLTFREDNILVIFKWKMKEFSIDQIEEIKAYSITDWGLSEYEQIDINFDSTHKIKLDGSLVDHQNFSKFLLHQLGIKKEILDWGFLPQLNDKMRRDVIFEKNNLR